MGKHTTTLNRTSDGPKCPSWCTAGPDHLDQEHLEDVTHTASELPGIRMSAGPDLWEVLQVAVHVDSDATGRAEHPYAAVTPLGDYTEASILNADELEQLADQVSRQARNWRAQARLLRRLERTVAQR